MLSFFKKESREGDTINGTFNYISGEQINISEGTITKKNNSLVLVRPKYPTLLNLNGIGELIHLLLDEFDLDNSFSIDFLSTIIRVNILENSSEHIKATILVNYIEYPIEIYKENDQTRIV